MLARVLVAVLIAGGLLAVATTAPAAGLHACGNVGGAAEAPRSVRADGISCRRAKDVAVAHWLVSGRFDRCALRKRRCTVRGFTCRRAFASDGNARIACARGAVRVRFLHVR